MTDLSQRITDLKRPKTLVRAARCGLPSYNRRRDLRRLMRVAIPATPQKALPMLMDIEDKLEERRTKGDAHYSPSRHVDILIALMGEARTL